MRQSLQIALLWSLLCLPLVASLGPQLSAVPAVTFSGGNSQDLLVVGDAAYVADGSNGIRYFPSFPASSSHDLIPTGSSGFVSTLYRVGDRLYASEGVAGLGVYDISSGVPILLARESAYGSVTRVVATDQHVYFGHNSSTRVASLQPDGTIDAVLSTIPAGGSDLALCEEMQSLYFARSSNGLQGFDLSDPANPTELFHFPNLASSVQGVRVADGKLFASAWGEGFKYFTIAPDGNLTDEQTRYLGGNAKARRMEVGEDFLFVNTTNFSDHEVKIIDLQTQRYIGSIAGMPSGETLGRGMARSGDSLYLSTGTGVIRRAEISQPHSPVAVASIDVSNYLYGGDANASYLFQTDLIDGLLVFDISDPLNPQHIATASTPGYSRDAVLNGHHLYVADGAEGLAVFDVSNPANPYRLYNYKLYGTTTDLRRLSIDRENDLLFAANMYGGVAAYQLHVPAQPLQVSIASPLQSGAVESVHADGSILYTAESPGENITRYSYDENGSFVGSHSFQEGNSNTHDVATIYVDGMSFPIYTHDGLEPKYYLDFSLMFGEDNTYLSILADGFIVGLETLGPYLLGSMSANGLEVRSVWQSMNPNHPSRIIQTPTNTMAARVTLGGDYAYAPDLGGGVQVIHVAMLKYFEEESRSVEQNGTLYDLYDPVSISFNKPILPQSVSGQISIQQNGNPIFWNEDINGTTLSLVPAGGQWATGSEYNITIDGNLMDIYNNHLGDGLPAGFIEWIFHTEP